MSKESEFGTSIAFGMCLGIVVGMLFDELTMGIAMGPLFGIILHAMRTRKKEKSEDSSKGA